MTTLYRVFSVEPERISVIYNPIAIQSLAAIVPLNVGYLLSAERSMSPRHNVHRLLRKETVSLFMSLLTG